MGCFTVSLCVLLRHLVIFQHSCCCILGAGCLVGWLKLAGGICGWKSGWMGKLLLGEVVAGRVP